MRVSHYLYYALIAISIYGCATTPANPPVLLQPVINGEQATIHLGLKHKFEGLATKRYFGGLIKSSVRIDDDLPNSAQISAAYLP